MTKRQIWITEADFDQQGSFCDIDSGYHYENVNGLGARIEAATAGDKGVEAIVVDAPTDDDSYGIGQRFNLYRSETDGQGQYVPRQHEPGR